MKNNNGITLITLIVMIIITLILASVGTTTGLNVIRQSKYNRAVAEMKAMQTKINEMYAEYRSGDLDITVLGTPISNLPSSLQTKAETAIESVDGNTENLSDYIYYSADDIKNTLDVDGIEGDYLVNIKTRKVISIDGIQNDRMMYYSLSQIEDEQFNVDYINPEIAYSPDGGMYILPKYITNDINLNMNIELSLQDIPYNMSASDLKVEYSWSTSKDTEPNDWTELGDETNITETGNSNITQAGEYYLWTRIIDNTDNKVLNTIVSKKYTIKKEYDILPNEYQEVNYIESSGTQYIDTGITPNSDTGFKVRMSVSNVTSDTYVFGCRKSTANDRFVIGAYSGYIYLGYGQTFADSTKWKPKVNETFEISLNYDNDRKGYYNGQYPVNAKQSTIPNMSGATIGIFKALGRETTGTQSTRVYNVQITQSGIITNNFVPCYRKSDNEIGFYDIENNVFYTNSGTGTFSTG